MAKKRPSMISRHGVNYNVDQGDPFAQGFADVMQQQTDRQFLTPYSQTYDEPIWSPFMMRGSGSPAAEVQPVFTPRRVLTPEQEISRASGAGAITGINDLVRLAEEQAAVSRAAAPRTPEQAMARSYGAGAIQSLFRWDQAQSQGRLNPETGEIEPNALTEEELANLTAPPGMVWYNGSYYPKGQDDIGAQVALRATWGHDIEDRVNNLIAANPRLASQALDAGMTLEDMADIENMLSAQTAAGMALDAVMQGNESRARQLLVRQSPEMSLISMTLFSDAIEKAQRAYEQGQESGENILVTIGSSVWNVTLGPVFDALIAANDFVQRTVRTVMLSTSTLEQVELGQPGQFGAAIQAAWDMSAPGYINPRELQRLRDEYGEREVDLVLEAYMARTYGDDDALDEMFNTYSNDQEALNIIFGAITGDTPAGTNYDDIYREISGFDYGNTGNLVALSAGLDPLATGFGQVRDVANITSIFAFDPTIAASKARSAYMFSKYGIHQMAGTANLTKAFSRSSTRRWFDEFGAEIQRIDGIADSAERGRAMTTLLAQSRRYANSNTVEIALKYKLHTADDFYEFLTGMETVEKVVVGRSAPIRTKATSRSGPRKGRRQADVQLGGRPITEERTVVSATAPDAARLQRSFVESQGAKRYGQVYTPHMSWATAQAKSVMRQTRYRLDVPGRILGRSTPAMDDVLGRDFSDLSREDQLARLTSVFQDDAAVATLGRELGDFSGQRTLVARVVDRVTEGNDDFRAALGLDRKGWRRKNIRSEGITEGLARRLDRWSRLMARMPDSSKPINWSTAQDADRIYQLMRRAGVHRGAASEFRAMWIEMNEAQRRLAYIGLIKTYGRAAGVDLVDPRNGMANLLEGVTGVRTNELYAANQIPRFGALMREVDQEAVEAAANIAKIRGGRELTAKEMKGLKADILSRRIAEGEFTPVNPSMSKGDLSSAVWIGQTSDYGFFPNIAALDNLTARSSYLNALLFNNKFGATVTDWWVLGTLGGPDFQLRNAVEEIGLYALTGGRFGNFMTGRQISTGIREGSERSQRKLAKVRAELGQAQAKLDQALEANATPYQIKILESNVRSAADKVAKAEKRYGGRSRKLGFVKTINRKTVDAAARRLEEQGRQNAADSLRAWLLPTLSKDEVAQARRAVESGEMTTAQAREFVAELQTRAVARQFLTMVRDPEARGIIPLLKRGVERSEMSQRQQQILDWVDDIVRSPNGLRLQDEASETSRHFADGVMPVAGDMGDNTVPLEGYDKLTFKTAYESDKLSSRVSPKQAKAIIISLTMATGDGPRGQAVLRNLKKYWYAANATPTADTKTMDDIVARITKLVDESAEGPTYRARLSSGQLDDPTAVARTPLDDLVGTFTTPDGKFNEDLWRALQVRTDDGSVIFKVYENTKDQASARITLDDFVNGKYEPPANTLVLNAEEYVIPQRMNFRDWSWSAMGRSFARMVREPIFMANYIDARQTFLPLEREWKRVFGEKQGTRLATDAATERAFELTMAYGDNPAVRSQLAWEVRNVARFYRAIEDFGRRMWRTARNNPTAFWKASLAWNASLDTGWVYEDEFGDAYFVYPGSKAAISVMNDVLNIMGVGMKVPELDMGVAGKVQFITPSADPESWVPTLSGVWASFLYRPMLRSLPGMNGLNKEIERAVFGSISADQTLNIGGVGEIPFIGDVVAAAPSSLPPVLNKLLLGVGTSLFGTEVPGSFSSRMVQKTALAMAANGDLPAADMTRQEKADYLKRLDVTSVALSLLTIAFGLTAPSAPQVFAENGSEFAKQMGFLNVRPALLKFIKAESEKDVPYEVAVAKWIANNPERGIFALSTNEIGDLGYVQATEGNLEFIQDNRELWNEMPTGMTFFMPNTGSNNLEAFNMMKAMGISSPKSGEQYATQLLTQEGYIQYITARSEYQDYLATPGLSDEERRRADDAWSDVSTRLHSIYPGLDKRTRGQGRSVQSDFQASVREAIAVAEVLAERGDERAAAYLTVAADYRAAEAALAGLDRLSADYDRERSMIKEAWETAIWGYSQLFPDEQWSNLMYHTTKALSDSWTVPVADPDRESE